MWQWMLNIDPVCAVVYVSLIAEQFDVGTKMACVGVKVPLVEEFEGEVELRSGPCWVPA